MGWHYLKDKCTHKKRKLKTLAFICVTIHKNAPFMFGEKMTQKHILYPVTVYWYKCPGCIFTPGDLKIINNKIHLYDSFCFILFYSWYFIQVSCRYSASKNEKNYLKSPWTGSFYFPILTLHKWKWSFEWEKKLWALGVERWMTSINKNKSLEVSGQ